jgi:hypothetical protein
MLPSDQASRVQRAIALLPPSAACEEVGRHSMLVKWRLDLSPRSNMGRQQWPQVAIRLIANWLLSNAAEFDNQLI